MCPCDGTGCEVESWEWQINIISHVHRGYDYSGPFVVLMVYMARYRKSKLNNRMADVSFQSMKTVEQTQVPTIRVELSPCLVHDHLDHGGSLRAML